MIRPRILISCLLASLTITGCASDPTEGYAFSSSFDTELRTVAVPIFRNQSMSRGLEVMLTEAVIKEIQRRTPWRIANTDRADSTLSGSITSTSLSTLSDNASTGLVQEQAVRITIRFDFLDNRTGDSIVARDGFAASATFAPQSGVGDRIELGQRSAIEELAQDLVSELRSGW
jgi:hypothetical protein